MLLDKTKAEHTQGEAAQRQGNGGLAPGDAPIDHRAKAPVERRVEHFLVLALVGLGFEQQITDEGCEKDRHEPRDDQGKRIDGENREGIFAGGRLGQANRQKSGGGNQGSGQHRHGR